MVLRQNDPQIARPGQRSTTIVRAKGGNSDEIDVVLSYIKIHSHAQVAHTPKKDMETVSARKREIEWRAGGYIMVVKGR